MQLCRQTICNFTVTPRHKLISCTFEGVMLTLTTFSDESEWRFAVNWCAWLKLSPAKTLNTNLKKKIHYKRVEKMCTRHLNFAGNSMFNFYLLHFLSCEIFQENWRLSKKARGINIKTIIFIYLRTMKTNLIKSYV